MCRGIMTHAAGSLAVLFAAALLLSSVGSSPAAADMVIINIEATAGAESASFTWAVPKVLDANGHMDWQMPSPMILGGGGGPIATVERLALGMDGDPGVSLNFAVVAGGAGTAFTVTSASVPFSPITNPMAYASAGITLTDANDNGASLTGLYAGGKAYEARYNAAPVVWADLVDSILAGVEQTVVASGRRPAAGREQIFDVVSSIQSGFHFDLSASDEASGTSRFDVIEPVPEPATMFLLGTGVLGMIGYLRRRNMN